MPTVPGRFCVRFGPFELDERARELTRDGRRVPLQEHPRQVLVALVERPGEVVSREELRERLWKSDTFVDFEHGLNTAVKKARQALGDSADSPRFIETVARHGYRFIAPVEPIEPSDAGGIVPAGSAVPPADKPEPARRAGSAALWTVVVFVVAAAGLASWLAQNRADARSSAPPGPASSAQLAVMPLRVLAPAPDGSAYLGIGLADAITTRLASTRQIALRPTSAVLPFRDAQSDPAGVAASLGVQHLLMGSVQRAGEMYRVTVQLVRSDGVAVWGRTFDEPRAGLLQLQDRLAEQVADALRIELSGPARERLRAHHTANPEAHELYLRGRSLLVNYTEANMRDAIGYFEKALALDGRYTQARVGVATASAWFSVRYAHDAEAIDWGRRADEEARRALEQDGSLADAHYAIASAAGTTYGGFEWSTVLDRSATALALDPSLDLAHLARMRAFYHLGLFDESRREARLAQALNPIPNVELERLEVALQLFEGRFASAIEEATALLARSEIPVVRQYLGLARYYAGDADAARRTLASIMRGDRPDIRAQASLASVEAALGLHTGARARIAAIVGAPDMDHHVAYSLGAAFAQLGDSKASLQWLERAATTGFPCAPWFERDPLLNPVRQDPAFVALLTRVREMQDQARRRAH